MAKTKRFTSAGRDYECVDVRSIVGSDAFDSLPYSARVLAENIARHLGAPGFSAAELDLLCDRSGSPGQRSIALIIPRVILPDSSGIPVLMDLAALRSAIDREGLPADSVDTSVPVDLVIDHSLQVEFSGSREAESKNLMMDLRRNAERYRFVRWAEGAFGDLKVFPPGSGIIHQVNIEQISTVVRTKSSKGRTIAYPDLVIGGDSHTPMVSALGVVGWGVGGIEAETAMLGQPYILPLPEFVGVRLTGRLREGITVTDLALTVTRMLRDEGVVGCFVEYFGPAVEGLTVPDRATLSNMAPEYGATTGFWAVDDQTLDYLRITGRSEQQVTLVEDYCRAAGLYRDPEATTPDYDRSCELDLGSVERTVSGPSKPYNIRRPAEVPASLKTRLDEIREPSGRDLKGLIAMASITSCTNTANPHAMVRAGLLARAAQARGLTPPSWVKTSMAPGSLAVTRYLADANLLEPLESVGFHVVGYACASCGGKSGPLLDEALRLAEAKGEPLVAVLSSNRNFDGRIHPLLTASYLCAPALVVAYALSGWLDIDVENDPLCKDAAGNAVHLHDLWPSDSEVDEIVRRYVTPDVFRQWSEVPSQSTWQRIPVVEGALFPWDRGSTYIVEPPFFEQRDDDPSPIEDLHGARALGVFGDALATDHMSPGGEILADTPAGRYLLSLGIQQADFNTYVARRGNHEVLTRATFANPKIRNKLANGREGGWTRHWPGGEIVTIFDASEAYRRSGTPLIVLGGHDYGISSSRDWAAKGPARLGVRAVIARSFERIHRSNLIGMGMVPLLFETGQSVETLNLDGSESFDLTGVAEAISQAAPVRVTAQRSNGDAVSFAVRVDVRSDAEAALLEQGGIFRTAVNLARAQGGRQRTAN